MTREEAIQILSTRDAHGVLCGYTSGVTEALDMAIEALKAEPSTEGKYEKAIKTLQEMPRYINSNTIGKKLEVLNHIKEE